MLTSGIDCDNSFLFRLCACRATLEKNMETKQWLGFDDTAGVPPSFSTRQTARVAFDRRTNTKDTVAIILSCFRMQNLVVHRFHQIQSELG
jgi:hypothetical protein